MFQFPGWMRKNFIPGNSAEGHRQNTELSRCIFQISVSIISYSKNTFYTVLYNFNFYFKMTWLPLPHQNQNFWPPPPPPPPPPPSKDFSEFLYASKKRKILVLGRYYSLNIFSGNQLLFCFFSCRRPFVNISVKLFLVTLWTICL